MPAFPRASAASSISQPEFLTLVINHRVSSLAARAIVFAGVAAISWNQTFRVAVD